MTPFELFNLGVFTGILIVIFILLFKRLVGCEDDEPSKPVEKSHVRSNSSNTNNININREYRGLDRLHHSGMERVIKKKK